MTKQALTELNLHILEKECKNAQFWIKLYTLHVRDRHTRALIVPANCVFTATFVSMYVRSRHCFVHMTAFHATSANLKHCGFHFNVSTLVKVRVPKSDDVLKMCRL